LTTTAYGWALLVKVVVAAAVLAIGAYNNRVLVPAITKQPPSPEPSTGGLALATAATRTTAWNRLRRTIRSEIAGLAVVVAVTAVLVNLQPAAEAAGVSGAFSTVVALDTMQLNVVVDPNRAGTNAIHLYVLTAEGLPAQVSGEAQIEMRLPSEELGPIVRTMQLAGPGHYSHTGPELAIPGEWLLTIRERVSEFEERTAEVAVTVNP
jgi:copper transport protein